MWHRLVRWIGRRDLKWFFRDVVLVGAERIPAKGPVLLIANHPNDLPDVLIGYLATPREVHYVATISAATTAVSRAVYRGLGVVPVSRVRDVRRLLQQGADVAALNRSAYRRVTEALAEGTLVGVFPEGGVQEGTELGQFRPGVAQMLLQCFDEGLLDEVSVVPMGIQYEAPSTAGSDVCATFGQPILVRRTDFPPGPTRVQQLGRRLRTALQRHVREGRTPQERATINEVTATIGASLTKHESDGVSEAALVGPAVSAIYMNGGATALGDLAADASALTDLIRTLGGQATSARDHAALRFAAEPGVELRPNSPRVRLNPLRNGNTLALLFTAPIAAVGWVIHGPMFALIWRIACRTAEGPAHLVARAYLPGIYIVLVWYIVVSGLAAFGLSLLGRSPWYALLLFMLLFRVGDIAVEWRHGFAIHRVRARARRLSPEVLADAGARYTRLRAGWFALAAQATSSPDPRLADASVRVIA